MPPDDLGNPDAVLSVIGDLAAYDHWRQRVTLVANAFVARDPNGGPADEATIDAAYDDACARLERLAARGARHLDEPLVAPPDPADPLPDVTSSMGSDGYGAAIEVALAVLLVGAASA